jgi:hypothetical protein
MIVEYGRAEDGCYEGSDQRAKDSYHCKAQSTAQCTGQRARGRIANYCCLGD